MTLTVRQFVSDSMQIITASSPTVPLFGDDLSNGVRFLNYLLNSFAASGLLMPIAHTTSITLSIGQETVTVGPASYSPTPDITLGRMANYEEAWLTLTGVTYPLVHIGIPEFQAAWKYDPLQGLPRFTIVYQDNQISTIRIYPAPSQEFTFNLRAKFQLANLNSNDNLDILPDYMYLFLLYAVARHLSKFKGRNNAWTPDLESLYTELKKDIEASSEVNLAITGDRDSLLNGAWRVRSGT